jgi:hypothetical protein
MEAALSSRNPSARSPGAARGTSSPVTAPAGDDKPCGGDKAPGRSVQASPARRSGRDRALGPRARAIPPDWASSNRSGEKCGDGCVENAAPCDPGA